jgi:hypothetical protein
VSAYVNCNDDPTQQSAERTSYRLKLFVEGIVKQLLIHVSHQVKETLLLRTVDRVVSSIKVCNKDTVKVLEEIV